MRWHRILDSTHLTMTTWQRQDMQSRSRRSCSILITYAEAVKISQDIAKNSWQTKWNYELCGSHTRQLILEVGIRLHFPNDRDTGISYCRLLLNDTMHIEQKFQTHQSMMWS